MGAEPLPRPTASPVDRELQAALPQLEACFRAVARQTRARFVTRTGQDLMVALDELRGTTVGELLQTEIASGPAVWFPFQLGRADLAGFVLLEGRLLSRLVSLLFGGGGKLPESAERTPSEVELSVGGRMCEELFRTVERMWPPPHPPRFSSGLATSNRQAVAELPPAAQVAVAELRYGTADDPAGSLLLVLPVAALKGLSGRRAAAPQPDSPRPLNFERVMPVEVEVVAELARFEMPFSALESIKVGDDLPLGRGQEVPVRVNDRPSYYGEAGSSGTVRSFRITRRAVTEGSTDRPKDR